MEDIHHFGGGAGLFLGMDIGEHGDVELGADFGQDGQAGARPGPRKDLPEVRLALSKLALKT